MRFLSTPSARRATGSTLPGPGRCEISIHALREEGDEKRAARKKSSTYFYPRPPRGGRLGGQSAPIMQGLFLSTPSARRATSGNIFIIIVLEHFYPRPPRGGRRLSPWVKLDCCKFLSTPSARRATARQRAGGILLIISIHALREEGDLRSSHGFPRSPGISIHALREEGDVPREFIPSSLGRFLSTPSARRATCRVTAFARP